MWEWQLSVKCPHFQQFLHWETPGFMFVPQIVTINHPTLNHWLMMFFTQEPLWKSQISTHTTALSDLGDTLIMCGFEANVVSLKRYESFKTPSIISGVITPNLLEYGSPTIFMYDLDLGRWGLSMKSRLIFWTFFKYFSIVDKSRSLAGLFVVMMILLTLNQMKSVKVSDLEFFRHLLTLETWMLL